MKTFRSHLKTSLRDEKFREAYDEEKVLLNISLVLQRARENAGISQQDIARQARLTQQQVSKLETGQNSNILTYLKMCEAVGYKFELKPAGRGRLHTHGHKVSRRVVPAR